MIPGNDDSIRAIKLYTASVADAVLEGKAQSAPVTSKDEFVEVVEDAAKAEEAPEQPAEVSTAEEKTPEATEADTTEAAEKVEK